MSHQVGNRFSCKRCEKVGSPTLRVGEACWGRGLKATHHEGGRWVKTKPVQTKRGDTCVSWELFWRWGQGGSSPGSKKGTAFVLCQSLCLFWASAQAWTG